MLNRLLQTVYRTANHGRQIAALPDGRRLMAIRQHPYHSSPLAVYLSRDPAPRRRQDFDRLRVPAGRGLGGALLVADGAVALAWATGDGLRWTNADVERPEDWYAPVQLGARGWRLGDLLRWRGRPAAAWCCDGRRGQVGLAALDGDGLVSLSVPAGVYPPVAEVGGGVVHLAWHDVPGRLWYAALDADGGTVHAPLVVDEYGRQPSLRWLGDRLLIAYEDDYPHVHFATLADGRVLRREHVTMLHPWTTGDLVHSPQLGVDRHGVTWLLFADNTRGCVFWSRWMGDGFGELYNGPGLTCRPPHLDWNRMPLARLYAQRDARGCPDLGLWLHAEPPLQAADYRLVPVPDHPPAGETVLFFDLAEAYQARGLRLSVNAARKHPANPLMELGPSDAFDAERVFNHGAVVRDGGRYRMWYGGVTTSGEAAGLPWWDTIKVGYAESDDGLTWRRVPVGLVERHGSTDNNLVPFLRHAPTMIRDDAEVDPERRYKSLYAWCAGEQWEMARTGKCGRRLDPRREELPLVLCTSPDGLRLTAHDARIRFGPEQAKPFEIIPLCFFRDDREPDPARRWKAYGFSSLNLRRRGGAYLYSADGLTWHADELPVLDPRVRGIPATHSGPTRQIHDTVVFPYHGWYVALYQCQVDAQHLDIELAASRDGKTFVFVKPEDKVLPVGGPDAFDAHHLMVCPPVFLDDEIRLYYGGGTHGSPDRDEMDFTGFRVQPGLATLRPEGFTSLRLAPGETEGELITLPIHLTEPVILTINAGCDPRRTVTVAVLDEHGHPLPGLDHADAVPVTGDSLAAPATWRAAQGIAVLDRPIRLSFRLTGDATGPALYSYRLSHG